MEKFYLGLDVGTDSVGIACTDESYNLLRAKGKDAWAVRLFDTAKTAVDRRMKRATRRRLQRRNERIRLTQELFAPHMQDELFFLRLHNSGFVYEDKDEKLQSPYALFADKMYTDKEFYKEFPTVYHLRRALADGNRKYDLRLYYLAVHHIVKYRGHFLFEGQEIGEIRDVRKLFERVNAIGAQIFDEQILRLSPENGEKCKEILLSGKSLNEKEKECCALFAADTKAAKEAVKLIVGKKGNAAVLFGNDAYKSEKTFSFKETDDITFAAWEEIYGDDFAYLAALKSLYDYIVFERVLSGCESVSESMVRLYEKHKSDLRKLKSLLTEDFSHEVYVKVFKSVNEKGNYASYVRHTKVGKKKVDVPKCSEEELYKYLKSVLSGGEISDKNQQIYNGIMEDIEAGTFLPKILHADNGRIPEQVNFAELHRILVNLVRDYPAFGQADANGLSAADKIEKIFLFKIPYYVGPLNTYHEAAGGNSWAVRLQEGKITPWNFDDKIDKSASNEKFMRRMTNRCTYLHNEYVLPRCSLLYQKYDVLNRLNKIRICEQPISVALKQELYNALFLTKKRVTDNDIRNYLIQKGYFPAQERATITVSGKDGDGQVGMTSYIVFKNILGDFADTHGDVCEDII
ncbi:MAG: type II CRISPR RNA-guided endonuclease Cas9, partial [Clostridiales bacterium]|nr:type II CRISPR RNA-guided endonuclease Cas9 [Clostridiales bacterium]